MPNVPFGAFVQTVLLDLADTLAQTSVKAAEARLRVNDIELDIPAQLHLQDAQTDAAGQPSQLIVAMPSLRETFPAGRVGRIRMTLEAKALAPAEEVTP